MCLEDLEAGNIENADEGGALAARAVERAVETHDQPLEQALVAGFGDCVDSERRLVLTLRLRHMLTSDFDARR